MLPERLAACVKTAAALRMLRVELDLPPLVEAAWWHESTNADPGHRRFLSLAPEAASGLVTLVPTENDYLALVPPALAGVPGQRRSPGGGIAISLNTAGRNPTSKPRPTLLSRGQGWWSCRRTSAPRLVRTLPGIARRGTGIPANSCDPTASPAGQRDGVKPGIRCNCWMRCN